MNTNNIINKCIAYINSNIDYVCKYVDSQFNTKKESIRQELLENIQCMLNDDLIHYEWYYDGCPYDYSGDLKDSGKIDFDQTIYEFLRDEYTGQWRATYTSHYGKSYVTYGESLSYDTLELADDILRDAVVSLLNTHFSITLTEQEIQDIFDEVFDEIYCSCIAPDFFVWEGAIEFVELGALKLCDIVQLPERKTLNN